MLVSHSLIIRNPRRSIDFYQQVFGMQLVSHQQQGDGFDECHCYHLCFSDAAEAGLLELQFYPQKNFQRQEQIGGVGAGYWKIGVTTDNVDKAAEYLRSQGIEVSQPHQFLDVGYMAHLRDPDGYMIELLQKDKVKGKTDKAVPIKQPQEFSACSTFAHISLRIANPEKSLNFYCQALGMKLLSRQVIAQHQFTLYFLAFTKENPPNNDIDAVSNRSWLWQRPYPVLELQFFHSGRGVYSASESSGFTGLRVSVDDFSEIKTNLKMVRYDGAPEQREYDFAVKQDVLKLYDPDGYAVRILSRAL